MKSIVVGVLSLALMIAFAQLPAGADELCNYATSAIADASKIRGLSIRRPVPCIVQNKEQVKQYILDAMQEKIPAKKMEMEEELYKALGFIPLNYNYQQGLVDLYVSQIGGYYDPQADHFVMAGWMPALFQTTIAVHELTHALQDQYYDLEKFMDPETMTTDELISRSALVEGDATAVMIDHSRMLLGQAGIAKEKNVQSFMMQNIIGVALMNGIGDVPPSLTNMLIFPYTSGLRFVHALLQKGGYGRIDAAFKRPPRSSEEILHPEKYFTSGASFRLINEAALRQVLAPNTAALVYQDVLGEFSISALLSAYIQDRGSVADAAQGWGGDRVGIFEADGQRSVIWVSAWDSPKDAEQFATLYRQALIQHFGLTEVGQGPGLNQSWAKGKVSLTSQGSEVTAVVTKQVQN